MTTLESATDRGTHVPDDRPDRNFALDHLRAALVVLVVLHHVALVYGASSPFYYVEPPFGDATAFDTLLIFVLVNQAWFMGAFFLLAGYFTPRSYDRKGAGVFVRDRLVRLGIPLVVYAFVLNPLAGLGTYLMPAELTGLTASPTWSIYPDLIGLGPLWFVAMLLVFTIGYAGWRAGSGDGKSIVRTGGPSLTQLGVLTVGLAAAGYLMRMVVPLGESVWEFPTLAYLPQYLAFFVLGVTAGRRGWFENLRPAVGIGGFAAAVVASVFLFPLAISGRMFSLEISDVLGDAMGDGHWQSAAYAGWDAVFSVGMVLAAIVAFRAFFGARSRLGTFLARQGYGVYVLHIPIVVYVAYVLRAVELDSLAKFGLASVVIVPTCFLASWVLRRIPGVTNVI